MKRVLKSSPVALVLSIVLILSIVGVAAAITITVDGIKEAAWNGSGGQTPGIQTDPDEPTIDNRYDIKEVRWTNDKLGSSPWGHMYFLVETYANYDNNYPPLAPQIIICMDVDNNTATGTAAVGYCNNMLGVDRRITVNVRLLTVSIERWNSGTSNWVLVGKPAGGTRDIAWDDGGLGIATTPYIEIGFDLQSLGVIDSATCLAAMPTAIYYDNGILDPEDAVPDSGTFSVGCGTPTAVTLSSMTATSNVPSLSLVAVLLASVAALGWIGWRRSRRQA